MHTIPRLSILGALALSACLAATGPAWAGIIIVTTTSDLVQQDGLCSIREALQAARSDTDFMGCTGAIGTDTILVPSGEYLINDTLAIITDGQDVFVSGTSVNPRPHLSFALATNHFDLQAGTGAAKVEITNLDIDGGRRGIRVLDNVRLVVENCIVRGTTAHGIQIAATVAAPPPGQPALRVEDSWITGIEDPNLLIGTGIALEDGPGDGQEVLILQSEISNNQLQGISVLGDYDLTIEQSTISNNGTLVQGGAGGAGVGMVEGDLTVTDSLFELNVGNVGGIRYADPFGGVELTDVILDQNQGANGGGGNITPAIADIHRLVASDNTGTGLTIGGGIASVTDSVFRDNSSAEGAGINIAAGEVTLTRVAVVGNSVSQSGGGILKFGSDPLYINSSTISTNLAAEDGGGIHLLQGSIVMSHSTVAHNVADEDASGTGTGGGLHIDGGTTTTLFNSILGDNLKNAGGGATADDCTGTLTSNGYNLVSSISGCTVSGSSVGNLIGVAPGLQLLANLGGNPATFGNLPSPTSPVIDSGTPSSCPLIDQRGLTRPFDGDGNGIARCDMGALEFSGSLFSDGFETGDTSAW